MRFKVNEIFHSIQGEGTRAGRTCVFVRLTGCPLRCVYCDTAYAFHEGAFMGLEEIVAEVKRRLGPPRKGPDAPFVELTGGEPLAIPGAPELLKSFLALGCEVAVETAGSHDIAPVPREVIKIMDRKTPASGEGHRWLESNLDHLVPGQDELKFVIMDQADYEWSKAWCSERDVWDRFTVLFSPVHGDLDPVWLAEAILKDALPVRFQIQLHKLIWGPDRNGV
ncbi:MAG: radical SAM protein [Holophagaceae bacterium]|nr:radical SAM protein [Holophagaceae bacterium]